MNDRIIKVLITVAIVGGAIGFMIYSSTGAAQLYKKVHEVMVEPDQYVGKTMHVHGYVEPGSIEERIVDQKTVRTFVLQDNGKKITVRHEGPVPDTFKDDSEVVAKGRVVAMDGSIALEAKDIMAKCPSKYEGMPKNKDLRRTADGESVF